MFSLLSYHVAARTHELGIRMALGEEHWAVLSLILAAGGRLVLAGAITGLAGRFLLGRTPHGEVFQVPVTGPPAILGVVAVLGGMAFLVCLLPAERAARLRPYGCIRQRIERLCCFPTRRTSGLQILHKSQNKVPFALKRFCVSFL